MIRNYLRVAVRNLLRHKFFSIINIFGLAISMSVCLGIIMLVADQMMYDQYNTKRDRIYRINARRINGDGSTSGNDYATAPLPLAEALTEQYSGIEKTVRLRRGFGNHWIKFDQDVNIPLAGMFADPGVLDLFEYELAFGNAATALVEPYTVVLTHQASHKLFGNENPIGKMIDMEELGEYRVTGVLKEDQQKSHIVFEALASYASVNNLVAAGKLDKDKESWENWTSGWVYALLDEGQSTATIEKHLADLSTKHKPGSFDGQEDSRYNFYLQPLTGITPGPFIKNAIGPFMPSLFVYVFGGLALIVMLTSCFNYTNLSIARALTRAREIGVRKVTGAYRHQIFLQFIAEAVVIAWCALGLALLLLQVVKPFLLHLEFAQALAWDLEGNGYVYACFLLFSLVVGIMAGLFPALILSRLQPVAVLKQAGGLKLFSRMGLRKTLLVVQFSLSLIFILTVIVLYNQLSLFMRGDHGFAMERIINVRLHNTQHEQLRAALLAYPDIESVSAASHIPAAGITYGDQFKKQISDQESIGVDYFFVDHAYLENLSLKLIAGRNFSAEAGQQNKDFMIINERAVKQFNFGTPHDAIGKELFIITDSSRFTVIGVVRDYNHQMLVSQIEPLALRYDTTEFNLVHVKYQGEQQQAVRHIEEAWAKVSPFSKLDYKNLDDEIRGVYKTIFSDLVKLVGVIAGMAIVIACLGLLGMAVYVTETRLKEISIRKALGSSSGALVMLLSKSFLVLLTLSIAIAVPAAWFINKLWLEQIAYHTTIGWPVMLTGIGLLLLLGLATIGSQTWRAAFANPVDHLKNE